MFKNMTTDEALAIESRLRARIDAAESRMGAKLDAILNRLRNGADLLGVPAAGAAAIGMHELTAEEKKAQDAYAAACEAACEAEFNKVFATPKDGAGETPVSDIWQR